MVRSPSATPRLIPALKAWLIATRDADGRYRDVRILPMPTGREPTPRADLSRPLIGEAGTTVDAVWREICLFLADDHSERLQAVREFGRVEEAVWARQMCAALVRSE